MRTIAWLTLALAQASAPAADGAPNVVFLLADDLGYGDLGAYGHPHARTPNLDRLAAEGTRFRQFMVAGITCCPSRTGFMTGRFPARYPTYPANGGFAGRPTVTELLKSAGYATGHFGKWHIGPDTKPGTYGIDVISSAAGGKRDERGRDAAVYDEAIRFIEQNRDRRFYVNVWGHMTHFPVDAPAAYEEKFKDLKADPADYPEPMRAKFKARSALGDVQAGLRNYLGELLALDESVGRLLKRLDELGLREKTLVVFSSDHGPDDGQGEGGRKDGRPGDLNMMGSAGELRGGKHSPYEGGVRVPFILRWPGRVPAGRVDEASVVGGVDWLPTLGALAGAKPAAADLDGEDVSAAWLGRSVHVRSKPLFWKTSNPNSDVALRDGDWKIHVPGRKRGEVELYDLSKDPGERENLAARRPEVAASLRAKVEAWNASLPKEYLKTADRDD
jgi:N-acetylgalactosamine-6-sulfatase